MRLFVGSKLDYLGLGTPCFWEVRDADNRVGGWLSLFPEDSFTSLVEENFFTKTSKDFYFILQKWVGDVACLVEC